MTSYSLGLFFHFLGLIAMFAGYGLEWIVSGLLRSASSTDQARAWLRVYRTSLPISGPGLLVLILSGGYLAAISGGMKQGWILASLLAIGVALVVGFGVLLPIVKGIRKSIPEGSGPLPANAIELLQAPAFPTLVRMRAMLAIGIVYLMTAKPDTFASSLLALAIAIAAGLLASVPVFAKTKAA